MPNDRGRSGGAAPSGSIPREAEELLAIADEAAYRARFRDASFGVATARAIALRHGLDGADLVRRISGSNLLFRAGRSAWIKLAPPCWSAAAEIEAAMLTRMDGRVAVATPRLLVHGPLGSWRYAVLSHVPGRPWCDVRTLVSRASRARLARDLGGLCADLHRLLTHEGEVEQERWRDQLRARAEGAAHAQRARGGTELQAQAIGEFLGRHRDAFAHTDGCRMIHGDLTDEHVLLGRRRDGPRLCGIIDFADAQPAPLEQEFLLPFLQLFPADGHAQRVFLAAYGYPQEAWRRLPTMLMALALAHRFLAFHEWFAPWLATAAVDLDVIARQAFPLAPEPASQPGQRER